MDVFEKFICPARDDFLRARMIDCDFGAFGGENPSASCMRGVDEYEHDWFYIQANEMFPLLMVDELAARRNDHFTDR